MEQIFDYVLKHPPSKQNIEAAKIAIIDCLTPKFAAFKCSSCDTLFMVDSSKNIDEYSIECPVCHFSTVRGGLQLNKPL